MARVFVWCELEANRQRLASVQAIGRVMDRCASAGIDAFVLHTRDTAGFVPYSSRYAPELDWLPRDFDLVQTVLDAARVRGLKVYAAPDVFVAGRGPDPDPRSPIYRYPEWACTVYVMGPDGAPTLLPINQVPPGALAAGQLDVFGAVFVNPADPGVQEYLLALIEEQVDRYAFDGVILDRCRYPGLAADFSSLSRRLFELFVGEPVARWPEDVYTLVPGDATPVQPPTGCGFAPGPYLQGKRQKPPTVTCGGGWCRL